MLINLLLLSSLINEPINYGFLQLKNNNLNINHIILTSQNIEIEKIGIVDFRFILKKSNAMKILGDKFISLENEMNKKMKRKQVQNLHPNSRVGLSKCSRLNLVLDF